MSRGDWATLRGRSRNAGQPWWCSSVRTPFATYPIVMLGLDPSIQGNRSVTRLWTLGSSPRVTIGEWQGCCVFCITTPPHTPLSSRHSLPRSEEHTSELQSLMRLSYAVFCLKKKNSQTLALCYPL